MFELLKDPNVQKLLAMVGSLGVIAGFVFRLIYPNLIAAIQTEEQLAEAALLRALKTPDKKDDAQAQAKLDFVRRIEAQVRTAREALDGTGAKR